MSLSIPVEVCFASPRAGAATGQDLGTTTTFWAPANPPGKELQSPRSKKKTPMLVFPIWLGRAGGFIPAVGMDWVTWVCSPSFIPLFFPPHFATHFLFSGCSVFICRDAEMLAMLWTTQSSHRASPSSKFPRYTTQTCRRMPHASCQLPFEALSCFPQHSSLLQCKNPFWQRRGFFFFPKAAFGNVLPSPCSSQTWVAT